jgi:hypothetical protein
VRKWLGAMLIGDVESAVVLNFDFGSGGALVAGDVRGGVLQLEGEERKMRGKVTWPKKLQR